MEWYEQQKKNTCNAKEKNWNTNVWKEQGLYPCWTVYTYISYQRWCIHASVTTRRTCYGSCVSGAAAELRLKFCVSSGWLGSKTDSAANVPAMHVSCGRRAFDAPNRTQKILQRRHVKRTGAVPSRYLQRAFAVPQATCPYGGVRVCTSVARRRCVEGTTHVRRTHGHIFFCWVISMISCSNILTQAAHLHNNGHVNVIVMIVCSFWYIRMRRKTFGIILLLGLWFVWFRLRRNNGHFEDRNLKAISLNKASMYSNFWGKFSPCVWIITHWGRHKMDDALRTTFSNAFY